MFSYFFTADHHFCHENVIEFCDRPFKSLDDMNISLVRRWNACVDEGDTIFVLGDFAFRNHPDKLRDIKKALLGNIIFIRGNHDINNGTKAIMTEAVISYGGKKVLCVHDSSKVVHRLDDFDFIFCGHSHQHWKFRYKMVNVGVDVWNFYPVRFEKILSEYHRWWNAQNKIIVPCGGI